MFEIWSADRIQLLFLNDLVYVSFAYSIYFSFQEVSYVFFDYRMCRDMSIFIFHPFSAPNNILGPE